MLIIILIVAMLSPIMLNIILRASFLNAILLSVMLCFIECRYA